MSTRRRRQQAQASVGARPDLPGKCEIFFLLRGGDNYLFLMGSFSLRGLFCYVFLFLGVFFAVWGPFCYFLLFWAPFPHGGIFLGRAPAPSNKISAGAHGLDLHNCIHTNTNKDTLYYYIN